MTPILQNAISPSKHTPQWILNKLRGLWRRHDALSRAVMSDDSHSPECIITLQAYTPMVSQQTTWLYEVWRGLWRQSDALSRARWWVMSADSRSPQHRSTLSKHAPQWSLNNPLECSFLEKKFIKHPQDWRLSRPLSKQNTLHNEYMLERK